MNEWIAQRGQTPTNSIGRGRLFNLWDTHCTHTLTGTLKTAGQRLREMYITKVPSVSLNPSWSHCCWLHWNSSWRRRTASSSCRTGCRSCRRGWWRRSGRRFNRKHFGLSFDLKNGLRFRFDSARCLNYPFLNIFLVLGISSQNSSDFSSQTSS